MVDPFAPPPGVLAYEPEPEEEPVEHPTNENPREKAAELDHGEVMKRWDRSWNFNRDNALLAYEDLEFLTGETQWNAELRQAREGDSRPCLTFNRLPQFIRQVTGDLRKLDLDIKTIPIDDGADEKIAEIRGGMRRYIENRSDAHDFVYPAAADSQVACGIGHWEVYAEYAEDSTFRQELGIRLLDDQVSVVWDADAKHPTRKDAMYCFCPVDLTREAYQAEYPDHAVSDLGQERSPESVDWFGGDRIRIARYWYKVKVKRQLIALPNGGYEDMTGATPDHILQMVVQGGRPITREGYQVRWVMLNGAEFLTKPADWPGRFIPVVPVVGEEIRVGARTVRNGIIRHAQDAQRSYNYARSEQTAFVGTQPRSPFVGTDENFKDNQEDWDTANVKTASALIYKPDPRNGGRPPERSQPPVGSPALAECVANAEADMQAVIGIYNASLGARSNETSGVAIRQREQQGDTGTFVYVKNFGLSRKHTARIIDDLLPHFYGEAQIVRVVGEGDEERREEINQPSGLAVNGAPMDTLNDITSGAYDVSMSIGPSFQTRREEAREGITSFIQAFPAAAPILAPVMADIQDWPNKDLVKKLLTTLSPPAVQAILAEKNQEPPPQPQPPDPLQVAQMQAEMAKSQAVIQGSQAETEKKQMELVHQQLLNTKAEIDVMASKVKLDQAATAINPAQLMQFMNETNMALEAIGHHVAARIGGAGGEQAEPAEPAEQEPPEAPMEQELPGGMAEGGMPMPEQPAMNQGDQLAGA